MTDILPRDTPPEVWVYTLSMLMKVLLRNNLLHQDAWVSSNVLIKQVIVLVVYIMG